MKIQIDSIFFGGIIDEHSPPPTGSQQEHTIIDADTGRRLVERTFDYLVEAELYLAAKRKELEGN